MLSSRGALRDVFFERKIAMLNTAFDWDEVDSLITLLQMNGISYLVGNEAYANEDDRIEPVYLLQRLAACGYPLVENACISLFILHPELHLLR